MSRSARRTVAVAENVRTIAKQCQPKRPDDESSCEIAEHEIEPGSLTERDSNNGRNFLLHS